LKLDPQPWPLCFNGLSNLSPLLSFISNLILTPPFSLTDIYDSEEEEEDEDHYEGQNAEGEPSSEQQPTEQEMDEDDSIHLFEGHTEGVFAAAWSPVRPDVIATGGGDDRAFVWRAGQAAFEENQGAVLELTGHTDTVSSLQFNSDGNLLATGGMDGRVKIWNMQGECIQTLEGPAEAIEWLQWHPKGGVVLAGAADFTAWMWLAATGACMQVFSGHAGPIACGGFTPDGKSVVTGGGDGDSSLKIWEPKTGECRGTVMGPHDFHTLGLTCLDVHEDSSVVITGGEDSAVRLVNIAGTGRVVGKLLGGHTEENSSIEGVAFVKQLPLAVSVGIDGKLVSWDVGVCSSRLTCQHPDGVTKLALHPTEPLAFTGCLDGVVRCWDLRSGECARTFRGHRESIQSLAVSLDGSMIVSGSDDGTCRVFSMV